MDKLTDARIRAWDAQRIADRKAEQSATNTQTGGK